AGSGRLGMGAQTELQADGHRVRLCRPLLTSTRTELEDVLSIAGVSPLIDPSNVDLRFLRNAIRHEVIPVLERVSPGFESTLLRAAALHERDANYCDTVALDAFEAICLMGADSEVVAERRMLRQLHPAIA